MTGARARPVMTGKMSFCRLRRQEPFWSSQSDGQDSSWRFDVGWTTAGLGPRSSSPVPRWLHDCCRRRPQRRRQDHVDRTALRSGSYRRGGTCCPRRPLVPTSASTPGKLPSSGLSSTVHGGNRRCESKKDPGSPSATATRSNSTIPGLSPAPATRTATPGQSHSKPAGVSSTRATWARRPDPGDHSRPGYAHPPPRRGQQPTAAQLRSPRPARGDARRVVPRNRTA